MLQESQVLLVEVEEAIQRLVSVKVSIADEMTRQVAEAPGKMMGAKKREVLSGLAQKERKTITDMDQFYRENIFGEPKKPTPKKKVPATGREDEEPKDEALVLTVKRPRVTIREPSPEPIQGKHKK